MPAPHATYRVQLHPGFRFDDAASIAAYLAELGVSHLHCSPYLQAAPGSTHGYDVVDHSRVNQELGGAEGHIRMCEALQRVGLGHVLDIVPNHMAIGSDLNRWWWDVLENGPISRYALYFDVDWDPPEGRHHNRVLLPVLGDHYGRVLESGAIEVAREDASFRLTYGEQRWPLSPRGLRGLLAAAAERGGLPELARLAEAFGSLTTLGGDRERWHREKKAFTDQLKDLLNHDPAVAAAVDTQVEHLNDSPEELDALHEQQNYRLVYWKAAQYDLGYRRFFDINSLAGLRVENDYVFAETHALVLDLIRQGLLDGLRIDHPDGLRDPRGYLDRLHNTVPSAWVVVEKILHCEESLPESWPVAGTTGYDFLNVAGGLFVDPAGKDPLTAVYEEFTGEKTDYHAVVLEKKRMVLRDVLGSDVNRLVALFQEVCEHHRRFRDYTRPELEQAVCEVAVCLAVYRTYARAEEGQVSDNDACYVEQAVTGARTTNPALDADLLDFLRDVLLLRVPGALEGELAMRFQQLTGPATAKGVEDTAFYCYNRLTSLNEVGGDPGRFGTSIEEFHRFCLEAEQNRPTGMLATSTHDTKRSEDVRARISLLSEIPDAWANAVARWTEMNDRHRTGPLPDRNAEYLFYQTLVGAWPISTPRILAYMEKAAREAKVHTSWTHQDHRYEDALTRFVKGAMTDQQFMADVAEFIVPLVEPGRVNSLSQVLLKLTAPGVPDIYQGTELWDLSLVDPDNRRPVDYDQRRRLLAELPHLSPEEILARSDEGLPKLYVMQQALHNRADGPYAPLHATGRRAHHVIAFSRGNSITAVPRLVLGLRDGWGDTTLDLTPGWWRNTFTGELVADRVALRDLLGRFPVALLSAS